MQLKIPMKSETATELSSVSLDSIHGCILGTAIGDAVGLKREGLSRDRAIWLHGGQPSPDLIFGKGFCSDDTEHTAMVGCALLDSKTEVDRFEKSWVGYLQKWLLTLPAGIGFGTLRAVAKSFFVSSKHYGVFTAGNGPAMRSALLGLIAHDDERLMQLNRVCTRTTHTDPKAEEGALLVARAARFASLNPDINPREFLRQTRQEISGGELSQHLAAIEQGLDEGLTPREFAELRGWEKGPTGYINQSVPSAIYCWAYSPKDFRSVVTNAVLLGGDTDSVAAIAGAIAGAGCGQSKIPKDWQGQLVEWPRTKLWMKNLSLSLHELISNGKPNPTPSLLWGRSILRNLLFGATILALYFRRFIPIPSRRNSKERVE